MSSGQKFADTLVVSLHYLVVDGDLKVVDKNNALLRRY
jgi:hypothetical protein